MPRSRRKAAKRIRRNPMIVFSLALGLAILLIGLYQMGYIGGEPELSATQTPPVVTRVPKALIYDPLYREYPNDTLVETLRGMLESHGYQVDVYLGRNATLEVFLEMGFYDIVIIRAHGGYANRSVGPYPPGGYIYTGLHVNEAVELYGPSIYYWIRRGVLAEGVIPPPGATTEDIPKLPRYVVVSPKFLEEKLTVRPGSIFLFFGCYGMSTEELPDIVLSKGASAFIAWNGGVSVNYMDKVLPQIIESYLEGGLSALLDRVNQTPPDPLTGAKLEVTLRS